METNVFNLNSFFRNEKCSEIVVKNEKVEVEQVLARYKDLLESDAVWDLNVEIRQSLKEIQRGMIAYKELQETSDFDPYINKKSKEAANVAEQNDQTQTQAG
eukprot:TRINITY_DN869_c0_g3_i1.p3 TRINITY_DN869_c0_g3~~TRINITY_DN869_c0_g3_i1.p3  ORF type:complete len:102 (-),score=19.84 TRINITY_DN869_c0_g3_i1:388-693(-)